MSWAERSTGISPTITDSCWRTCSAGIDSIDADIVEQIDAHLALFMWNAILDTRVLIAEKLGAAPLSGPDHCTTPTRVGHRDTCVCPPLPKDHDHDEEV